MERVGPRTLACLNCSCVMNISDSNCSAIIQIIVSSLCCDIFFPIMLPKTFSKIENRTKIWVFPILCPSWRNFEILSTNSILCFWCSSVILSGARYIRCAARSINHFITTSSICFLSYYLNLSCSFFVRCFLKVYFSFIFPSLVSIYFTWYCFLLRIELWTLRNNVWLSQLLCGIFTSNSISFSFSLCFSTDSCIHCKYLQTWPISKVTSPFLFVFLFSYATIWFLFNPPVRNPRVAFSSVFFMNFHSVLLYFFIFLPLLWRSKYNYALF